MILSPYVPVDLEGRRAVVAGGSVAGLAAALALGERGAEVILVDADEAPMAESPSEAFHSWPHRHVPQLRHSHALLARLRNILLRGYPAIYRRLLDEGAMEINLLELPPPALRPLAAEPGDEELAALGCRRTTFEWVVRRAVEAEPWVEVLPSTVVTGLRRRLFGPADRPRVSGVRIDGPDGERTIEADLVVDATGRKSRAADWLESIGAARPTEERSSSSILYYTRFYRLRPGSDWVPPGDDPALADYGWVKFAIFPGDNRTFSITFAVPTALPRLKVLAARRPFETLVASFPGLAPWIDPEISEPLPGAPREVLAMGGLENCRRRFVDERGRSLATGFFAIGDAAYHTNPLYGRGCTQAFLHAGLLGEALDAAAGDVDRAGTFLDLRSRSRIEPFYEASVQADRAAATKALRFAPAEAAVRGSLSARLAGAFFEDGVIPASRTDPVVYRAFVRMFNMMATPEEAFYDSDVVTRILRTWLTNGKKPAFPNPPDLEETLLTLERAAGRISPAAAIAVADAAG